MSVLPYSTSSLLGFGVVSGTVTVANVPAGATVVRIRSRPADFIRVYVRAPDGFEQWHADFTSESRRVLRLTHCVGKNIRPLASRPSPLACSA